MRDNGEAIEGGWRLALRRVTERIWSRLAAYALAAVAVALAAGFAGRLVPDAAPADLGQGSVETLLQIVATSMLAVTTFSLTAMISAYSSAALIGTPRATQLLVQDRTSQNALSSFLGAFVFAIVGLAALSTGYYGEQGRVVLYAGTLVVIALVVVTLLRWIQHLIDFGRMKDILDRVEDAARDAGCANARTPHLGGVAAVPVPPLAREVDADRAGIVTAVHVDVLGRLADQHGLRIHVRARPGSAVARGETLAAVEGDLPGEARAELREAFLIERHRTFEQDPRLGMVALAEIGSRALSPSTHDPGTAIEALGAMQRVLTAALTTEPDGGTGHARVHVPAVPLAELLEDGLRPVARDGAGIVEVALRLQRVVAGLLPLADGDGAGALRRASSRAEERALAALTDPHDREDVAAAARAAREAA